ncbi:MAG: YceI family protein [Flavobacteriaceae bacterium]
MNTQETQVKTIWNLDSAHSEIAFKVKHMMISTVTGHFENFKGVVETQDNDFNNANFEFSAEVDSINTKNADRDGHLKSGDFFDAATYPELSFKSTSFDGERLIGELTIKDVTKEVALEGSFNGIAVDPYGQTKAGMEFSGGINRKDFGLSWSAVTEAGSIVVGEQVKLVIDLQFIKA